MKHSGNLVFLNVFVAAVDLDPIMLTLTWPLLDVTANIQARAWIPRPPQGVTVNIALAHPRIAKFRRAGAWTLGLLCVLASIPAMAGNARADNPIVQTIYTADPAPLVYNGRVYLYTGHDEDASTYFTMKEWRVYSSADMVNWTDHGSPMSLATFSWASANAWAGQVIARNGQFYWYVPVTVRATGAYRHRRRGLEQPHRAVHRRPRPSARRERRDRSDRLRRRRRAGVPVLGQPATCGT